MEATVTISLEQYEALNNKAVCLDTYQKCDGVTLIKQHAWSFTKHNRYTIISEIDLIKNLVADGNKLMEEKEILRNEIQELKQKLFEKENPFFIALIKNALKTLKNEF